MHGGGSINHNNGGRNSANRNASPNIVAVGGPGSLKHQTSASKQDDDKRESLKNIQKINNRLRARNPVVMSMQNQNSNNSVSP